MARVIEHPRVSTTREVVEDDTDYVEKAHTANVAERIVWLIAGVIITLLGLRFVFALLGANPNNGLAQFVYNVSHPFVAPFFNLFNYNYIDNGVGRVEIFTLVAILVYALLAGLIARLVSINRP
jgi:YggT family protein